MEVICMIEFKQDGKAEIILMGRIKYQEVIGLEVKRGRPPAGPAPATADLIKLYVKESRSGRRSPPTGRGRGTSPGASAGPGFPRRVS